jgi:cytochrome c
LPRLLTEIHDMRVLVLTSVLSACAVLVACGGQDAERADAAGASTTTAASPAAPPPTAEEAKALLATLPAPYNTADLENGERKWLMCKSCHTLVEGGANLTGPPLHGMFGRPAASLPDFKYSEALKAKAVAWTPETVDPWLADPRAYAPGTKMSFAGVKTPKDRTDLIAYLMVNTGTAPR